MLKSYKILKIAAVFVVALPHTEAFSNTKSSTNEQSSPFIEPERFSVRNTTVCPKFGTYSAEIQDIKGKVRVISISSPSHHILDKELEEINRFLSPFIGMLSYLEISCDPRGFGFFSFRLFPRDISKGVIRKVDIEWGLKGYEIYTDENAKLYKF